MINQWSTAFGPKSNPSVFEVLYLVKYFGGFKYFISHDIKNRFKNAVTLAGRTWWTDVCGCTWCTNVWTDVWTYTVDRCAGRTRWTDVQDVHDVHGGPTCGTYRTYMTYTTCRTYRVDRRAGRTGRYYTRYTVDRHAGRTRWDVHGGPTYTVDRRGRAGHTWWTDVRDVHDVHGGPTCRRTSGWTCGRRTRTDTSADDPGSEGSGSD